MTDSVNLRSVALDIILEVNENKEFTHVVLNNALTKYQYLDKNKRAFITRLTTGTIETYLEMDYIINQFSKTPVKKMKPVIKNILRMSVYQLIYMDSVPDSAVCNEAVKLASKRGFTGLKGFVNGVLRNIARNKDNIEYPDKKKDILSYLSVKYSIDRWILDMWKKNYSDEEIADILSGIRKDKKTYIRCNTLKAKPQDIKKMLEKEGVKVNAVKDIPYAYEISDFDYLNGLETFKNGYFQVQDISSMMAGEEASPKADDFCIDVCAAPGGKSINAALKMHEAADLTNKEKVTGKIISRDISDYKTDMIRDNIERLGIDNIIVEEWNALDFDKENEEKADIVIADLPCSGLGIMGRKPDIKYNLSEEKIMELAQLQKDILSVVHRYVKPGGLLVYSTCTISSEENEKNADWLCENYGFEKYHEYKQILPGSNNDSDGFFIAKLRRTGDR